MHLLLAQKGALADSDEAVDLGQEPADLIFVSAADTELACMAAARAGMDELPSMRLANMMALAHPMSIDVWCQKTVAKSRMVIVRCLGGESYWPYGLEALHVACVKNEVALAVLPGDDKPDPSLERFNTVPVGMCLALWDLLVHGGVDNAARLLAFAKSHLCGENPDLPRALPLLKAGLWWPGKTEPSLHDVREDWIADAPVCAISFYRALVQSGNTEPVAALIDALQADGINALPVFVSSLKDDFSQATVRQLFDNVAPDVVINLTGFAVSSLDGERVPTVLEEGSALVLQALLAGNGEDDWRDSAQGLSSRDLAMNVALPEVDGRVLSRAIAFKNVETYDEAVQANIVRHIAVPDRVSFVAKLATNWARLRNTPATERRVALVLANYPNRDGRLGNGVGLDTPAATVHVLKQLEQSGYRLSNIPADSEDLMNRLMAGPTNWLTGRHLRQGGVELGFADYQIAYDQLPAAIREQIQERWGRPEADPFFEAGEVDCGRFKLSVLEFGNVVVGLQPTRGYNVDPAETYHSPDLVPPHNYLAFYFWLRNTFGAHVIVHMGKHGNMEWLPGKALALSQCCLPEAVFGPTPHVYPFIVNDPGEGTQAKRRSSAVIIDHLTPPLTRAESYGPLKELEALIDEYYEASGVDPRRLDYLRKEIFALMQDTGLDKDAGVEGESDEALTRLDAYLCELKEMQIRDGLHVFGQSPEGRLRTDLAVALVRLPRRQGEGGEASLLRALSNDLKFGGVTIPAGDGTRQPFDPLDCAMEHPWEGPRPKVLWAMSAAIPWRSAGDTVERLEWLCGLLVNGLEPAPQWKRTRLVVESIHAEILSAIDNCGGGEMKGLLSALNGRFVAPGPSGAPTRGRVDVLPTGRNFFSVDSRTVPTPAAWHLGQKSAELLLKRHRQDHGEWPTSLGLSAWGTSNMRTGGDDIAQAMALIGVRPVWDHASRRVTGYEIVTLAELGRPRVDVTLRISGFFRDAFPVQIDLFDKAVRAIAALDEDDGDNPIKARFGTEEAELIAAGVNDGEATKRAGYRIFGSKPGAYGAGLQALIDEKGWAERSDLAEAYLAWGSYAYGANAEGEEEREQFEMRLSDIEAVVHNQDNREHDLLDSDDYYQFEGGMTAAVEHVAGKRPTVYHNDHSRPERPVIRTLEEEIGRVVRARVVNPKWIAGVMRHGYKGAFEIAATVDYMFAFSATTGALRDHHFDAVYQAFLADDQVRQFMEDKNPAALREMADRLLEAQERGLWTARSNSARIDLERLSEREHG